MLKKDARYGRVPAELIAPLVASYLKRYEIQLEDWAERFGVSPKHLKDILTRKRDSVDFNLADEMLCEMNLVHLWRSDPELREVYVNIDLTDYEPGVCQLEGCEERFEVDLGAATIHQRKFCSEAHYAKQYRKQRALRVAA